jgi:hypothetical protein
MAAMAMGPNFRLSSLSIQDAKKTYGVPILIQTIAMTFVAASDPTHVFNIRMLSLTGFQNHETRIEILTMKFRLMACQVGKCC